MGKISLTPHFKVHDELMENPKYREVWEAEAPQRAIQDAIIEERIRQKMTQEELAQKANMKRSSLARVESGGSKPSYTTLAKLAQAFGKELVVKFA